MPVEIRPASRRDSGPAARVLAEAFEQDPVIRHILPSDRDCRKRLPRYFALSVESALVAGNRVDMAFTTNGSPVGAAVWRRHEGKPKQSLRPSAIVPKIRVLGPRVFAARAVGDAIDRSHPDFPHWYLACIGVVPDSRDRSIGARLLESRLAWVDESRMPVFLFANSSRAVPLYERHGFTVQHDVEIPHGPTAYAMLRTQTDAPSAE